MAYANLIGVVCADKTELFTRTRDFLCKRNGTYDYSTTGIGWTLHDSSYAVDEDNPAVNDWYVIYSPGEGGGDDLYFKCTWVSEFIRFEGFQSWDATAHAGSANGYNPSTSNNWTMAEADAKTLWVYGDLDTIAVLSKLSTTDYRTCYFGKCQKGYNDLSTTVATCASTLTAGSDVSITVDSIPANWATGKQVFIRTTHNDDMATVKVEKITIKTLVGSTITADLVNSYTAGSALSDFVGYVCQGSTSFFSTIYALISPIATGTGVSLSTAYNESLNPLYFDPDNYEQRVALYDIFYFLTSGLIGVSKHVKRTPPHNAEFTSEDILVEDDGTQWRCFNAYSNKYVAIKEV